MIWPRDSWRDVANGLPAKGYDIRLSYTEQNGFHILTGEGEAWCPRVYVGMITELFQQGVTRCLVGTRGLLGEGWDAPKANVLVSLTAVTTSMSVNQLHGRSLRLDPQEPEKLADNWDVVCIAPEFTKGLEDYHRFTARHETLYGLTDDGAIEKGVGHVHAAFTELKPEGIEGRGRGAQHGDARPRRASEPAVASNGASASRITPNRFVRSRCTISAAASPAFHRSATAASPGATSRWPRPSETPCWGDGRDRSAASTLSAARGRAGRRLRAAVHRECRRGGRRPVCRVAARSVGAARQSRDT